MNKRRKCCFAAEYRKIVSYAGKGFLIAGFIHIG